ncbi:MAG: hypothetical protein ACOYN0_16110 [Phycisphaerales bacterium]
MNTTQAVVAIDPDTFLRLYTSRAVSLAAIADALGVRLPALIEYIELAETQRLIGACEAITQRREKLLAAGAIADTIHELKNLAPLPAAHAPADHERRRRALDATRKAADMLRKLYTPPVAHAESPALSLASPPPALTHDARAQLQSMVTALGERTPTRTKRTAHTVPAA